MPNQFDVVVVGGGLSGVLIAEQLSAARLRCLVVEAGPLPARRLPTDRDRFAARKRHLLHLDEEAWRYRSTRRFEWVRVRAGGGRSLLWGGWCVPPERDCLAQAERMGASWPRSFAELAPFVQRAGRVLRVHRARAHPRLVSLGRTLGARILPKLAAVDATLSRPLVALDWLARASVRAHTVVLRVLRDRRGAACGVEAIHCRSRMPIRIGARAVVLCASPVETARIIHMSDATGIGAANGPLGRGLVDHMVAGFLVVTDERPPTLEAPGPLERAAWIPPQPARHGRPGLLIELRGPIALSTLDNEDLGTLGASRRDAKALSYYAVHAIGEAAPHPRRRVSFDTAQRDALGRPIPVFHLAWSERDKALAARLDGAAREAAEALGGRQSRVVRLHYPLDPGGIGHEAGTCRMGLAESESVTDRWAEARGIPRLFVADASVLPTALNRHPTWTLLAVTLGTAAAIVQRSRRGEL